MSPVLLFLIEISAFEDACQLVAEGMPDDELATAIHDLVETEFEGADPAAGLSDVAQVERWLETAKDPDCLELADEVRAHSDWTPCSLCNRAVPVLTAHNHQGRFIGDECCWDERLRSSE